MLKIGCNVINGDDDRDLWGYFGVHKVIITWYNTGMLKIEERFLDFLKKHYLVFGFVAILVLALLVRFTARDFVSGDYSVYLSPWFEQMKTDGGFKALANYPGDYNAPYMTIMAILTYLPFNPLHMLKTVSILFDVVLAIACVLLTREIAKNRSAKQRDFLSLIVFGAVLFLPAVIMNSSFWGQCDSIYASFIVFAIYFLMRKKFVPSFLMLGVAFAFKFQTIFVLPFFLIFYFTQSGEKKFSILHFLIIPVVDFVMCLPAIFCGWPVKNVVGVYLAQGTGGHKIVLNFPSLYNIMDGDLEMMTMVGVGFVLAVCFALLLFCVYKKPKWDAEKLMALAIVSMIMLAFVMPKIHERYMYVAEILGVIYCLVYGGNWRLLGLLVATPVVTYSRYLFGVEYDAVAATLIVGAVGSYASYKLLKTIGDKNSEVAEKK